MLHHKIDINFSQQIYRPDHQLVVLDTHSLVSDSTAVAESTEIQLI